MDKVKAIETHYNGYRFRSRLEARWAVFFDTLGVDYRYEMEGFELPSGKRYLPDFYIPKQKSISKGGFWIEVKGISPGVYGGRRCDELGALKGEMVFLFFGAIPYPYPDFGEDSAWAFGVNESGYHIWDNDYWWCICPDCGKLGIEYEGRSARLDCGCIRENPNGRHEDKHRTRDDRRLVFAYKTAREARFEFGESG